MDYVPDIGIMYAPYLTDTYDEYFALVDSPWFKKQMDAVAGQGSRSSPPSGFTATGTFWPTSPSRPQGPFRLKIRTPT